MIADLHNHTPLCRHAYGEPREYIKRALELGTKYFGFSDHAPMNFDKEYRMSFDEMKTYENMIKELKEEFKHKIEILFAYEVDFLDNFMDKRIFVQEIDYLIGSVHFLNEWGFDNPEFIGTYKEKNIDDIWKEYFSAIKSLAKSGLFDIVGHLDLLKIFKYLPKTDIRILAKEAMRAIKENNLVIEINSAGFRKPICEQYPSVELLQMANELDIPITFCSDAHEVEHVGYKSEETIKIAKDCGYRFCAVFSKRDRDLINF
ncbi:MAG: histidinol-phosphatase [Campylobacteraceae bacterium]|jgi:histidinol-phosphatase (PHP family)|nr:histidinol-phosphatase [Campylobacteraceae bacterium]